MSDAAGELAERFHLLRLHQLFVGLLQRLLREPALGDVTGDFGKADQGPIFFADGIDYDVGPEAAAVLAYAPTFRFEPAFFRGSRKGAAGQTGLLPAYRKREKSWPIISAAV